MEENALPRSVVRMLSGAAAIRDRRAASARATIPVPAPEKVTFGMSNERKAKLS